MKLHIEGNARDGEICIMYKEYTLTVKNDGSMRECIIPANDVVRFNLTPQEKQIISYMWKAYITHDYVLV